MLAIAAFVCACNGGSSDQQAPPPPLQQPNCIATLPWIAPTERHDDTPLALEEIDKFTIFVNTETNGDADTLVMLIDVEDPFLTLWEIRDMPAGTFYFRMTATDVDGLQSNFSNELKKTFDERCP